MPLLLLPEQSKCIFSHFWRLEVCNQGASMVRFRWGLSSWLTRGCLSAVFSHGREREKTQVPVSLPLIMEAPPSWPHVTALNLPNTITLGLRAASRCEFWSNVTFNPYQVFSVCIFCLKFFLLWYIAVDHWFSLSWDIPLWEHIIWVTCSFRLLRPVEVI